MGNFKRHPVGVLRARGKVSRVHALEVARRAMEKGGGEGGEMMPLTSGEMPNPFAQGAIPQDPTSQWPAMMQPPGGGLPGPGGGADQDWEQGYLLNRGGDMGPGGGADQDRMPGYIPKRRW